MICNPLRLLLALVPSVALCQTAPIVLPAGTQLPVSLPTHLPMRAGEPLRAELLYPVYVGNQLILPARTVVLGTVLSLTPDHVGRVRARLGGDFTPFDTPVVRFTSIVLPSGVAVLISTGTATDGAPVYRLVAPPKRTGGFLSRQFQTFKQAAKDRLAVITGPEKADRAQQFLYRQLPYHPQRIAKATAWTVETDAPVTLTTGAMPALTQAEPPASGPTDGLKTWILQAYLATAISSVSSKSGQPITATVAEPVLNPDGSIAVPQGSTLSGTVTQARPARKFSRAGQLHFSFRQLTLPGGQPQSVRATLTGVDSAGDAELALDSEGNAKPKPQDKLLVPLILIALAARPLDHDGGRHRFRKDAVASNSLGLVGFLIGTAARKPNLAAGIGYYGAALSIYQRIFARGKEVAFPRDTRVVIQTTATRSSAMKPAS